MFPSIVSLKKPGKQLIDEKAVRASIEKALKDTAKEGEKLFHQVDSTWRHNITIIISGVDWGVDAKTKVTTEDEIFWWLNEGVPRHAVMAKGFMPKTTPGKYQSGSGGGNPDPIFISKKGSPVGFIESRGWTQAMADDLQIILYNKLDSVLGKNSVVKG